MTAIAKSARIVTHNDLPEICSYNEMEKKSALLYDKTRVIMLNENTNIAFVNNNLLIKILNK